MTVGVCVHRYKLRHEVSRTANVCVVTCNCNDGDILRNVFILMYRLLRQSIHSYMRTLRKKYEQYKTVLINPQKSLSNTDVSDTL